MVVEIHVYHNMSWCRVNPLVNPSHLVHPSGHKLTDLREPRAVGRRKMICRSPVGPRSALVTGEQCQQPKTISRSVGWWKKFVEGQEFVDFHLVHPSGQQRSQRFASSVLPSPSARCVRSLTLVVTVYTANWYTDRPRRLGN